MPEAPHTQAIPRAREGHDGNDAQQTEPERLKEVRLEGEAKARAGIAPDSIIIAGDYAKSVCSRRKPGVVGSTAVPRINPALVEAVESIPEERALRHQKAQRSVVKLPLLRTRGNLRPVCQRQRYSIDCDLFDVHGRWQGIRSNMPGIHPHDATNVWKPQHAILRTKAGSGIAAIEFGRAQAVREAINMKRRRAGPTGCQGVQLIAWHGHQTLVGGEPNLVRIILEKLHYGLPQRTAGAR